MASQTPARAVGLPDVGALHVGASADLVLLDDSGELNAVMRRGEWLSNAAKREDLSRR
jgi:N-acetylglucosamine-6-phosphate deacetylase